MPQRASVVLLAFVMAVVGTGCADQCVATETGVCVSETPASDGGTDGGGTGTDATGGTSGEGSPDGASDGGVAGFEKYGETPNGGHISLDCTPSQIPAFAAHDCLYSHFQDPQTVTCTLKMADRLGLVIGVATPVSFMAEAGAISPVAMSPAFPADPDKLGHAEGYLEVFGSPLPADVAPMPGEVSAPVDFGCGPRTANPRDGYVTVIAWVKGEEGFVDVNHNGKYDPGEPFVDLGEPFVDVNDNGVYDGPGSPALAGTPYAATGEWFFDVNGDGKYTGPNGKWDADTVLWTQTRVVYGGLPAFAVDASSWNVLTRIYDLDDATSSAPPGATPAATPFYVHSGDMTASPPVPPTTEPYGVFFTDALLNPLDPTTEYSAASVSGNVQVSLTTPMLPLRTPPSLFRLLYCDSPQFPAECHDGPVEFGCRTSPCYVVPEVGRCVTDHCSGFQYGTYATLSISGIPGRAGRDAASVSAKLAGVTTSFSLPGVAVSP